VEFHYNVIRTDWGRTSAEYSPAHGIFLYGVRAGQTDPRSRERKIADKVSVPYSKLQLQLVQVRQGELAGACLAFPCISAWHDDTRAMCGCPAHPASLWHELAGQDAHAAHVLPEER